MVEIAFTASQDYRDAFHEVTLDALFETPQGRTLKVPAFWAGGRDVEGPLRLARGGHAPLAKRVLRAGGSGLARTHGDSDRRAVPRRKPALSSTARCASPPTGGISSTSTARRSSGWAIPGGWGSASGCIGRRSFSNWPPTGRPRVSTWCRSWPGCTPTCRPSIRAGPTRRASLGKRTTPASGPSTSTRPTSGSSTWSTRASCPALSAPGDTIFPGWAPERMKQHWRYLIARYGRFARGVVRGGRRHHAVLWLQARAGRGRTPETRLDRGDPLHPGHRPVRQDDHHPSLAIRPGNGHRPGDPRFRHAPDRPRAGKRHRPDGPADAGGL